jgi:hypothetical protein
MRAAASFIRRTLETRKQKRIPGSIAPAEYPFALEKAPQSGKRGNEYIFIRLPMSQDDLHAGRLRNLIDLLGFLIIELSEASMIRWPPMCERFIQKASPAVITQQFHVAVPPLFTPRYNIAASRTRRNGHGSGNYAGPTEVPTPNRIGQNHEASII